MLVRIKEDESIWITNPSLHHIKIFRELRAVEGDERSSNIVKSIYLIWSPKSELKDSGVEEATLIREVSESLLGNPDFDWDPYLTLKEYFLDNNISEAERLHRRYGEEIEGLTSMLKKWKWSKTEAKDKTAVMKGHEELMKQYLATKKLVEEEKQSEALMHSDYTKSLFEQQA